MTFLFVLFALGTSGIFVYLSVVLMRDPVETKNILLLFIGALMAPLSVKFGVGAPLIWQTVVQSIYGAMLAASLGFIALYAYVWLSRK